MGTAGIDCNMANNIELLKEQSLKVKFYLEHTDYQKVENIGTGAYGVVCSAVNKKTKQKVAIKKIPNIFTMDPRYAIRTYREIKILQHFRHDNIIAIREILKPKDRDLSDVYVVMDLMESDLHRIIYSKQILTNEHVKYFLYQILRGLKYIHSANVIHRDLKPSNLLVNANCELKIGDFGMARGVNSRSQQSNQQMTMYVATRWYRAPELIMDHKDYGTSIDMWSVGCIFAEMLRRKHLFPGSDMLHQLSLIIGVLGKPTQQYLDELDSQVVSAFIRKMKSDPKTCAELCPKASPEAVHLLSKLLVLDPNTRISVDDALKSIYLSRYNEVEPVCAKKFDFSFEQEILKLSSDDAKVKVKLKELIMKEVLDYQKPKQKPVDFASVISSKPVVTSPDDKDNPYADLNTFLAQLASSHAKNSNTTNAYQDKMNPLLAAQPKPNTNLLPSNQKATVPNSLLAGQPNLLMPSRSGSSVEQNQKLNSLFSSSNSHTGNALLNGQSSEQKSNALLSSQSQFVSHTANLGPGDQTTNSLLADQNTFSFLSSMKPDVPGNSLLISQKTRDDKAFQLATNTLLSQQFQSREHPKSVSSQASDSPRPDSDKSNDSDVFEALFPSKVDSEKLSIDTLQKPSDDIEMLSAKLLQAEIREEKPIEPQDAKALIRQRIMKAQQNKQLAQQHAQEKSHGKTSVTAYQRQKAREEKRKQKLLRAKEKKTKSKQPSEKPGQLLTDEDQKMLERWRIMAIPKAIQPKPEKNSTATVITTKVNEATNVIVVYPAGGHTFTQQTMPSTSTSQSKAAGQTFTQQTLSITSNSMPDPVDPSVNSTTSTATIVTQSTTVSQDSQISFQTNPIQSAADPLLSSSQTVNRPFRTFGDITSADTYPTFNNHSSSHAGHTSETHSFSGVPNDTVKSEPSNYTLDVNPLNNWTSQVNLGVGLDITSLASKFSKSQVDDNLPPMLVSTPKGTGGGYGVGYDMEAMISDSYNHEPYSAHMDSAPLSASLLADWMDVTSNMDPQDLERMQHELELTSNIQDFPFNQY